MDNNTELTKRYCSLLLIATSLLIGIAGGCGGTGATTGSSDFTGNNGTPGNSATTTTSGIGANNKPAPVTLPSHYKFVDLSSLTTASLNTEAVAINDSGAVVVNAISAMDGHVYIVKNGKSVDCGIGKGNGVTTSGAILGSTVAGNAYVGAVINPSGSMAVAKDTFQRVEPVAVDSSGNMFGMAGDGNPNDTYAVVIHNGTLSTIGSQNSNLFAVNSAGTAVGAESNIPEEFNSNGAILQFSFPPDYTGSGEAYGINTAETAVGAASSRGGDEEALEWSSSGAVTELSSVESGTRGEARAINSSGIVVGWSGNSPHACIFMPGKPATDLNSSGYVVNLPSGYTLDKALAINDDGNIVGYGNSGKTQHAFLLLPQ